jgi:rare lipoprotein A
VPRCPHAYVVAALTASAIALGLPAVGQAAARGGGGGDGGSGGAGVRPSADASPSVRTATTPAQTAKTSVQPANSTVTALGGGITITTRASGFLRNQVRFTGAVPGSDAGDTIEIQRLGHQTDWVWANTAHSTVGPGGSFTVVWRANHIGRFAFRATLAGAVAARAATASPSVTVTVYRTAFATIFGPGLYGNHTACGERLKPGTIGVANRSLRCGEKVAIYYNGRSITVPVIDRGPYANGADFDLTMATAKALQLTESANIGAVSLPRPPSQVATTFR